VKVRFEESRDAVDQCHDVASFEMLDGGMLGGRGVINKTWIGKTRPLEFTKNLPAINRRACTSC